MAHASFLAAVCTVLYLPGVNWGLPAVVSWSQDTIAGVRTLGAIDTWPQRWAGRYPPLQYILLRGVYEPILRYWVARGAVTIDPVSGRRSFEPRHATKIGLLIFAARMTTIAMAIGTVLALWYAAVILTGDHWAASFGGLSFSVGAAFTYFAHLGNVDVPSIFWFAVSVIFYARCLRHGSVLDAVLLGLFGSACISTKDNWAGVYPGMALVLAAGEWDRLRRDEIPAGRAIPAVILQWRWAAGLIAFVLPYALLNGVFSEAPNWLDRLNALADAAGKSEYRHANPLALALETAYQAAGAVGWPMMAALVAACIYALRRMPRLALALLIPGISYYLIVISRIEFVYERFLFAPLALASILLGAAFSEWVRTPPAPAEGTAVEHGSASYSRGKMDEPRQAGSYGQTARRLGACLAVSMVLLPTLGYALAIDLEMINDSRYAAEAWFEANVPKDATVGALAGELEHFSPQYLPRVHEMGYATFPVLAVPESFERPQPDFLILSSYDQQDFDAGQQACVQDLLAGRLGYDVVAEFRGRFLGAGSSWLSLAGWYAPAPGKISPTITILKATSLR